MTRADIKKTLGSTLAIGLVLSLVLVASGRASALLSFIGNDLTFSGTVTQVNPTSFEVDKGGTYPFTIVVDSGTFYESPFTSVSDLSVGESVLVEAREDQGMLVANTVAPVTSDSYGYGGGCEPFEASEVWVSAIEDGVLFLSRANITFEVTYDGNTEVLPGEEQSVEDLEVGERIAIVGDDCDSDGGIYAITIIRNGVTPPDGSEVSSCDAFDGYVFSNSQVLLSHDEGGAFTPYIDIDLPAGTYNVYGVSYDNHSDNSWDTLTNESWYVEGMSGEETTYVSNSTDDLPDDLDFNETQIGSEVEIDELESLRFVHSAFVDETYQSITPLCVAFVPVDGESEIPATELEEIEQ